MGSQEKRTSEARPVAVLDDHEIEHRMDGGLQAWLQLLGSWLLFANTWFVPALSKAWSAINN